MNPFDFKKNSIEHCFLVLDLNLRYYLYLVTAWLECHELWIDWRPKTLGATRFAPSGALESHEPISARNKKRYWRETLAGNVSVLDTGMSELVDSDDVKDMRIEKSSICDREAARTPLSDSRCESSVLNAETLLSKCRGLNPSDERGVARKYSLSDVGCDSDTLNVILILLVKYHGIPIPARRMHVKWHVIHVMTTSRPMTRHRMSALV